MPTDQHGGDWPGPAEPGWDGPGADRPGGDGKGADRPAEAGHGIELLCDLDAARAWWLLAGGVPQSHVDLDDPQRLELEYVRRLGHLVDLAGPPGTPLRVLHLGGGALTLARYVAATRPGSTQLVVESDPEVVRLVQRRLPLDLAAWPSAGAGAPARPPPGTERLSARTGELSARTGELPAWAGEPSAGTGEPPAGAGRIEVRVADAREVLEQIQTASFDLLIADVFAGASTPAHLTSVEFTAAAARVLVPSGVYAVNVGDGPPLAHARGRVAAVRAVFGHVCVIAEPGVLHGRRYGNLVVAAAGRELPIASLTRRTAADPFPARLVDDVALDRFVSGARPITDAHAEPSPSPPPEVFA